MEFTNQHINIYIYTHTPGRDFEFGGWGLICSCFLFFWLGWSNPLIFTDFQLPLLFLSSRLLSFHSSDKPPKITENERAAPRLKPLVLSKAVVVLFGKVWRGEERILFYYWKVAGTHHTLEVIGFCRHRFGVALDYGFRWNAVAEMHGWDT